MSVCRSKFFPVFFSLTIVFIFFSSLSAQSTHSRLKDPELLQRFQSISNKVLCTCGCNMPLHYCNHIGHCNGWPMRRIIDGLLAEGKSDEFIIDGFINGFPAEMVDSHPAFELTRSEQYAYLVPMFKNGLGEAGFTEPRSPWPIVLAGFTGLAILGAFILLIRSKIRKKSLGTDDLSSEEEERIMQQLNQHNND